MRKTTEKASGRLGWLAAGLIVLAILSCAGFAREYFRSRQIDEQIQALKAEAERLQVRNFQVSSIEASMQNGEYLEREARLKLGLQKTGEQVIVLRKDEAPQVPVDPEKDERPDVKGWSNPRKWWTLFADPKTFNAYVSSRSDASG